MWIENNRRFPSFSSELRFVLRIHRTAPINLRTDSGVVTRSVPQTKLHVFNFNDEELISSRRLSAQRAECVQSKNKVVSSQSIKSVSCREQTGRTADAQQRKTQVERRDQRSCWFYSHSSLKNFIFFTRVWHTRLSTSSSTRNTTTHWFI